VYFLGPRDFENHHGGVVLVGDSIYGGSGNKSGTPVCLDFMTGKIKWKNRTLSKGSAAVLYADGNLIFRYEDGLVALIEATPDGFRGKGTFKAAVVEGEAWPYPVIHDGKLYLRAHNTLMCYDVKATN
jgi:outer membrane protein assembly factor BamB